MRTINATIAILGLTIITPARGATLHVPTDYGTIQACIDAAVDGVDECVVAPGTYYETINFNGKAITVRSSDGAEVTTIDATDLNDSVVKCVSGEGADTVLDGFTITGGTGTWFIDHTRGGGMYNSGSSPTVTNCTFGENSGGYGGGMHNDQGSHPTLTNCAFSGNWASGYIGNTAIGTGGGIHNSGSATLTNCTFSGNWARSGGGGMSNGQSSPTLTNCTFSGNWAGGAGGGVSNYQSSPTLTNCIFSENRAPFAGGGMSNHQSSPTLTNCAFSGNFTGLVGGGGVYNDRSSPTLTDCTFSGNSAYNGGGVFSDGSSMTLTNCTFSANSALAGDALACSSQNQEDPSAVVVKNCILWDGGDEILNRDNSTITIVYSDVRDGWTGPGSNNLDTDPLFVDPGYWDDNGTPGDPSDDVWVDGDYRLQTASPCIDAGDPAFVPQPGETDLDGHARVLCSYVDMGAYEFGIGDQDCDDVVDLTDFAQWDTCMTGPEAGPYAAGCEAFDFDGDTDIDLADFAGFQTVFQGS